MSEIGTPVSGGAMELVERLRTGANHVERIRNSIASDYLSGREHGDMREAATAIECLAAHLKDATAELARLRSQGGAPAGWRSVIEDLVRYTDIGGPVKGVVYPSGSHADVIRRARAMLSAAPQPPVSQSVPEGFVLVPDASNMTDDQAEAIARMAGCCGGIAYDIYRVALEAAPRPPVQPPEGGTGWRDIASAPKDGTEVIGWRDDCGPILVRWTSAGDFLTDAEAEESGMTEEQLYEESWFYADFVQGGRLAPDEYPTHWMPLPSPPGQDDRTKDGGGA